MPDSKIVGLLRSFQRGANFENFDEGVCERGTVNAIKTLLSKAPLELDSIVVITCADPRSKFCEAIKGDDTPTTAYLKTIFPEEIALGKIHFLINQNWGSNPGSASALNQGIYKALSLQASELLVWSSEIALTGSMLTRMHDSLNSQKLVLSGFARQGWHTSRPWSFAQNTCALWDLKVLCEEAGGFDPVCNGNGTTTVETSTGQTDRQGMEDWMAYLHILRRRLMTNGETPRWGLIGVDNPVFWNLAHITPGTERYDDNMKKISRQEAVMESYLQDMIPGQNIDQIMSLGRHNS